MYKHNISLESYSSTGKDILAQDADVALLVDRAIHHHQLRFAWCMERTPYHEGGADISIRFLGATVPLVSHQHTDELRHDHHSGKDWTWTHRQISHETDGSISGACVAMCSVGGDAHESVWGFWLDVLSDTRLLPNIFGLCGQKHDVHFALSALPW